MKPFRPSDAIVPRGRCSPRRGTASRVIRVVLHRQRSASPRNRSGVRIFAEVSPTMATPPSRTSCSYRRRPRLSLRSTDATRLRGSAPIPMRSLAGSLQRGAEGAMKPEARPSLTRRLVPGVRAVESIVACPSGTMMWEHRRVHQVGGPSRAWLAATGGGQVEPRAASSARARARGALPASAMPSEGPGDVRRAACGRRGW